MLTRRIAAVVITLISLASTAMMAAAQDQARTCPNQFTFGVQKKHAVNNNLVVELETTYFTTSDPNAFISEKNGIARSATFTRTETGEFTAKLERLESSGLASIRKQAPTDSFAGEIARADLERNPSDTDSMSSHAGPAPTAANYFMTLDRQTEVAVLESHLPGNARYYMMLLSSQIKVEGDSARKVVDLDAGVFLAPGQTAIFKLINDNGPGRSYVAITLRSVEKVR